MWNQCGISCIKAEQVLRGNVLSLKALVPVAWLIFMDSPLTLQAACYIQQHSCEMPLFGTWETDNEVSDTTVHMMKNYKSSRECFPQYFKISVYIKNEMNCSLQPLLDCAELHSLPASLVQWGERINNIIMMGYPTQRSPWLLLFSSQSPSQSRPPTHENAENVKWGSLWWHLEWRQTWLICRKNEACST